MMRILRNWVDAFTGSGDHGVTVPPLDGPLHPNTILESARRVATLPAPENLNEHGGRLIASSGKAIFDLSGSAPTQLFEFEAPVISLAVSERWGLAVALGSGKIEIIANDGARSASALPAAAGTACPVAMLMNEDGTLTVANGSSRHGANEWKRDLMSHGVSGSVWQLGVGREPQRLADQMAFPYGLARLGDGTVAVSEAWRHRIVTLRQGRAPEVRLANLPGYPSRLARCRAGGWWMAVFAPRTQMVEFVLREKRMREEMLRTIDPDLWMAPRHASGKNFKEPLQGGGIKQLGILKPWAPSQSYGLVIRLDDDLQPLASFHSRADGEIHGVTSCVERQGSLYAASRGAEVVVAIKLDVAQ